MMENFGMTVCQPSPAAALKEIAKQISDRDNSVRSAALNCIVTGYFIDGEKVLKMVGQVSCLTVIQLADNDTVKQQKY